MTSSEYLSNDILEEDFIRVFSPFLSLQWLLGTCRVDARYRFVTPPTFYQKLYTVLVIVCISLLVINSIHGLVISTQNPTNIALGITIICLYWIQYICNIIHVRFINNDANVKFYIKIQEIDRLMKPDIKKHINDSHFKANFWTVMLLLLSLLFVPIAYLLNKIVFEKSAIAPIIGMSGLIINDFAFIVEICYCSNLIVYFFKRVRYINAMISAHIEQVQYEDNISNGKSSHKSRMNQSTASSLSLNAIDTEIQLRKVFECFNIFQELYNFQVFFFFSIYLLYITINFAYDIVQIKNTASSNVSWTISFITRFLGLAQVIVLCLSCEAFLREVEETKQLSTALLSLHYDGPLWEKARNIVKTIEKTRPCFSVYDMWNVDASLILKLLSFLTSVIVTELQFAFL